jgi:cellulose biosynthesis protein BcsQ
MLREFDMLSESLPFLDRVWRHFGESGWEDWLAKLIVLIVVSACGTAALWVWSKIWPQLRSVWGAKRRLDRALAAVGPEGNGLWLATPIHKPSNYAHSLRTSVPIIVVANLKGGVGKTTVAANLLAHYTNKKQERVLGIDLDFQGSLTANALSEANRQSLLTAESDNGLSKSAHLIYGADAEWLTLVPDDVNHVPGAKLVSTYYSLAGTENRIMVEWLLGNRNDDVRYQLARVLHDPEVQRSFDRVIIDAPPRLTTASIQALCAATHVLIPTVLDELSTEAVAAFADQLRIHQSLWPHLKIVGVVGTMTRNAPVSSARPLADVEVDSQAAGRLALAAALETAAHPLRDATFLPIDCFIPDKLELSRAAGHRIAYASPSNAAPFLVIREAFDRLGDEIDRRIAVRTQGT